MRTSITLRFISVVAGAKSCENKKQHLVSELTVLFYYSRRTWLVVYTQEERTAIPIDCPFLEKVFFCYLWGVAKKLYNVLGGLQVLLYVFFSESVHKQSFFFEILLCN